jgi:hypothetical protein
MTWLSSTATDGPQPTHTGQMQPEPRLPNQVLIQILSTVSSGLQLLFIYVPCDSNMIIVTTNNNIFFYLSRKAGHSGYPKISGRVIRVVGNSGIENCYPIFALKKHYPKFRVPDNSGSGSGFTRYTRNWQNQPF